MNRRSLIALVIGTSTGAAFVARAQAPRKIFRIAVLIQAAPIDAASGRRHRIWTVFFDELRRLGYEEGRNLSVEWRSSAGDARRVADLARETIELKPDLIYTADSQMARALKASASAIPCVAIVADPVGLGLAVSLARPGGSITGFSIEAGLELIGKRIALLKEVAPAPSRIGWLAPRRLWEGKFVATGRAAMQAAGMSMVDAMLESPAEEAEYRRVFAAMARDRVDSLYVTGALENLVHRRLIAQLAAESRIPAIYQYRENVEVGGLLAYVVDLVEMFRRAAGYIDQILKGSNPAEMPFQQPAKFDLIINLKTAKMLGLKVPEALLVSADEVIE